METRQEAGKAYPSKSLYSLLCALYRLSCSSGTSLNFLDKTNVRFAEFHRTLDSVCSQLHSHSGGASTNSVAMIPLEDEEALLDKIMSMEDPISLQNMVFLMLVFTVASEECRNKEILRYNSSLVFPPILPTMMKILIINIQSLSQK